MSAVQIYVVRDSAVATVDRIEKTDAEWKRLLTAEQYEVTTRRGTEVPGTCALNDVHGPGLFQCVRCGNDLFRYVTKFESGTGWPSFFEPVSPLNVAEQADNNHRMRRTEVLCARCDSHLGHVFDDGPPPTGKRYCVNGIALKFVRTA
jgi:peptide-methionine (R)-S-oxide reductase